MALHVNFAVLHQLINGEVAVPVNFVVLHQRGLLRQCYLLLQLWINDNNGIFTLSLTL